MCIMAAILDSSKVIVGDADLCEIVLHTCHCGTLKMASLKKNKITLDIK